jgi:integral membrane protein
MNSLKWFRWIAIAEGISFLVLLLIAMPLKYMAGLPAGVTIIGWAHGALFVGLLVLSLQARFLLDKNFSWLVKVFIASLLPFGTFVLERQMNKAGDFVVR